MRKEIYETNDSIKKFGPIFDHSDDDDNTSSIENIQLH